jgi:hypothetical protein
MTFGMPQPTEHHRKLAALEGTWTGVEKQSYLWYWFDSMGDSRSE